MLHVITTWRTQTSEVGATVAPVPKSINCINHSSMATLVIKVTGVSCLHQNYSENLGVFRIPRRKVSTDSAYSGILALLCSDWLCVRNTQFTGAFLLRSYSSRSVILSSKYKCIAARCNQRRRYYNAYS